MPRACSGDMYSGEPSMVPVRVRPASPVSLACSIFTLAMPKSSSLITTLPSSPLARNRLAGLISRCTTPAACALASPTQACATMRSASSPLTTPMRRTSCCTSSPSMNSMAMYGQPVVASVPVSSTWQMCCVAIAPAAFASRWKRPTRPASRVTSPVEITFTATRRPVPACIASYTAPIPPAPITRVTS